MTSRKEALLRGDLTYQALPCPRCGDTERYVSSYNCVSCNGRPWNHERVLAAGRRREAAQRGAATFQGMKCRKCGSEERYTKSGACVACCRKRAAAQYLPVEIPRAPGVREAARQAGLLRYHGRACRNCGTTERYTSGGACVHCMQQRNRYKAMTKRSRYENPQGDRLVWLNTASPNEAVRALYESIGLSGWHLCYSTTASRHVGEDVLSRPADIGSMANRTAWEQEQIARLGAEVIQKALGIWNMRKHDQWKMRSQPQNL